MKPNIGIPEADLQKVALAMAKLLEMNTYSTQRPGTHIGM